MEKYKACPSKNLNIEKSWDLVIFALIFSEFGYVPDFFYVFLKNQGKNDFFLSVFKNLCSKKHKSQLFSMFKFLDGQTKQPIFKT